MAYISYIPTFSEGNNYQMCEIHKRSRSYLTNRNFSSEFRSTTVYFEVAEIEVRLKQEVMTGVLDPEGQKPTWIQKLFLKAD